MCRALWLLAVHGNVGHHGQVAAELLAWQQGMHGPALVTSLPRPLAAPPPLFRACTGTG